MTVGILVPDVHARAPLAAVRSLGRAGYHVHAASSDPAALGLQSAFAHAAVVHPPFDDPAFINWLRDYTTRHDIRMIMPTTGILMAVRAVFGEFRHLLPVTGDEAALYRCFDKTEVVRAFLAADPAHGLMDNHPGSAVIDLDGDIEADGLPALPVVQGGRGYFVKAEGRTGQENNDAPDLVFAADADEAVRVLRAMAGMWHRALVQEACTGRQVGVSVLMDKGRALAVSAVRDCHALPHSRGTMSLRESCRLPEIEADAIARLAHLNWQGCAMGEYRLDEETGRFNLIEINFRFWQYLHLDLWAGIDYPRMQAEWFLDGRTTFPDTHRSGVICRDTWPGEVAQLVNELRRADLGGVGKLRAVTMFFLRFLNPRIHQDLSFPGDRALYWRGMARYFRGEVGGLFARPFRKRATEQ